MASSLSSRLTFYDESGAKIEGPVEGRQCGIIIDIAKELHPDLSLKLGAVLLPIRSEATRAYSIWPASGPGQYDLALLCGNIREHRSVTVMPSHFTGADIISIINDLTDFLPKSIASRLRECGAQLGTEQTQPQTSPAEDEWLRLRNAITGTKDKLGLLQILPIIERECNQILLPRLEVRTIDKMRRPDISRLPQAISMPGNLVANDELYQMFDVTVERSLETYENQLVKTYVQALRSRLSRLQTRIKSASAPPAMANQLDALANDFQLACARATFLRKVKRSVVSADRVTMVLLKNPAYRAVLEGYLALNQQSSITLEEQALNEPLDRFPFLYQLWANLKVLNGLLQICAEAGYRCVSHHWIKSYRKGVFIQVINDGKIAVQLYSPTTGTQVNLIPLKPVYENQNTANLEEHMSLAIAIDAPQKPLVVLLFDPRYNVAFKGTTDSAAKKSQSKTGQSKTLQSKTKANKIKPGEAVTATQPLKDDVDELLRSIALLTAPTGERQIQYAALLYPGQGVQIAAGVEAITAHPAQGDVWQKNVSDMIRHYLCNFTS